MRKAGNIVLWICIIIVILLVFLPFAEGYLFKTQLQQIIAAINREGRMQAVLSEYHLGWLQSNAKVQLYPVNKMIPVIVIESSILHGPLVKDQLTHHYAFGAANIRSNVFVTDRDNHFHSPSLVEFYTLVNTSARCWHNELTRPGAHYNFGQNYLSWSGVKGTIDFKLAGGLIKKVKTKIVIGAFSAASRAANGLPLSSLQFNSIIYKSKAQKKATGLWEGESSLTLPHMLATFKNDSKLLIEALALNTKVSLPSAALLNLNLDLKVKQLQVPIDFPLVTPLHLSLSLENLNAQHFHGTIKGFLSRNALLMVKDETLWSQTIAALLTPSSNLQQTLSANTALGNITEQLKANLPGDLPLNSESIQQKTNLSINLRAAIPLIEKLISTYIDFSAAKTAQAQNLIAPNPHQPDLFTQGITQLLQANKINLKISMQLISYHDQNMLPTAFAANIGQLNLPADVGAQLNSQYQTNYYHEQALHAQQPQAQQAALNSPELQQQTKLAMLKQLITSWTQQGYIIQDKNNYITSIMRNNGAITINGKTIAPALPPLPSPP